MEGAVGIIKLFCKDLSKEITIRQISKAINKSYAYTNKEVWDLIEKGILNKKDIGKSVICSINLKNEETKALLAFNSFREKQEYFKAKKIELPELKDSLASFFSKNKLYVIAEKKLPIKNAKVLTKAEFASSIKEIGLDNLIVYGYEKYWEIIGDIYEK